MNFDFCVKQAYRTYRRTYLKTSSKAIIGGAGIGLGLAVAGIGVAAATHSVGDAALPLLGRILTPLMEVKDAGVIGAGVSILSGKMAIDSIKEASQNSNNTEAEIQKCKRLYPNADHGWW